MLDKGLIFVYKVINKGLMKVLGGRSSVVEHQLPKLDTPVRFWSPAWFHHVCYLKMLGKILEEIEADLLK